MQDAHFTPSGKKIHKLLKRHKPIWKTEVKSTPISCPPSLDDEDSEPEHETVNQEESAQTRRMDCVFGQSLNPKVKSKKKTSSVEDRLALKWLKLILNLDAIS